MYVIRHQAYGCQLAKSVECQGSFVYPLDKIGFVFEQESIRESFCADMIQRDNLSCFIVLNASKLYFIIRLHKALLHLQLWFFTNVLKYNVLHKCNFSWYDKFAHTFST